MTDEGALPELVNNGEDGLLAPPGDAAAFAAQIIALLDDAGRAAELGARAARAAQRFDANAAADRVWARYQALVGAR